MMGWSDLPFDLLGSILIHLPIADHLRFGSVCASWRSAAQSKLFPLAPQSPWLMLPSNNSKKYGSTAHFFSPSDRRIYAIPQPCPPISDRLCIGSSHGWLITADHTSELHLLNPITRAQIPLPSIATFPFIEAVRDTKGRLTEYIIDYGEEVPPESIAPDHLRYFFYEKAILSSDPSSECYTVVLIHNPLSKLAFARAGDKAWTSLDTPNSYWVDAITSSSGQFYALESMGKVESWDFSGPAPRSTIVAPPCSLGCYDCTMYLVKLSPGNLLQVRRRREQAHVGYNWEPRPNYVEYVTRSVEIFELGRSGQGWVAMGKERSGCLREFSLFLGKNCSLAVSVSECSELRGNCISLTDDRSTTFEKCHDVVPDVGVFDLEDGSFKPCDAYDFQFIWPPPIWITPSLC